MHQPSASIHAVRPRRDPGPGPRRSAARSIRGPGPSSALRGIPLVLLAGAAGACNGARTPDGGRNPVGSIQFNKETGRYFIVDDNDQGLAPEPRLSRIAWGRLVDVYGLGGLNERVLMQEDLVIGPDLVSDGTDYELVTNPVTIAQELTILRNVEDASSGGGRSQFFDLLKSAEANLRPIFDKGFDGSGFFTMVPRNSTVVLQISDLVAPATLDGTTVRVRVGNPTVTPFEGRLLVDPNHGDIADFDGQEGREFYPTRILIDTTVSELESFELDPPLTVNNIGLPASSDANLSNLQIRIPTVVSPPMGQAHVLANPSGHPLTTQDNGTVDFDTPTRDVTRVARSGGDTDLTGDPYDGFLRDDDPPHVVGQLPSALDEAPVATNPPPIGDGREFLLPVFEFLTDACAQTPRLGDILEQPGIFAEVIDPLPGPPVEGVVLNLSVRLLVWPEAWDEPGLAGPLEWQKAGAGPARFLTRYDAVLHDGQESCFVELAPLATGFPDDPLTGVFPTAVATVRFSEPVDVGRLSAFDSLVLSRAKKPKAAYHYVVGSLQPAADLLELGFVPELPLDHATGQAEKYWLIMGAGPLGPTDLAGNPVATALPGVRLTLEPSALGLATGGRVSRFSSADEETPFADPEDVEPLSEWTGQHVYHLARQTIGPRSVTRFEAVADRTQPMVAAMVADVSGSQVPLSNHGAKMQTVWRHEDMGLPLSDETTTNIDVEGLNWAPLGGQAVVDHFDLFEIRLGHGAHYPDELVGPAWPYTGLEQVYGKNLLDPATDPQKVVHERSLGYTVDPGSVYLSGGNTKLIPFPLNESADASEHEYWTWRDTSVLERSAEGGFQIPSTQWHAVMGLPLPLTVDCLGRCPGSALYTTTYGPWYGPGQVQSVALPLLLEFRCWPDSGAIAINRFDTSLAASGSTRPYFRAYSAGGEDTLGETVLVDPDLEVSANGGFNPNSVPNPGQKTFGLDPEFTLGSADFVVRVSRSLSVWLPVVDGSGAPFLDPRFHAPTLEPRPEEQPLGTSIEAAFRAATAVAPAGGNDWYQDIRWNARRLDLYGDHYPTFQNPCPNGAPLDNHDELDRCTAKVQVNVPVTFLGGDDAWHADPSEIDGAAYYQVRLTFTSNARSGLAPELASFALCWSE